MPKSASYQLLLNLLYRSRDEIADALLGEVRKKGRELVKSLGDLIDAEITRNRVKTERLRAKTERLRRGK